MDMFHSEVAPIWQGTIDLAVIGMGESLPGEPISTEELLANMDERFGLDIARRGRIYAEKLNIKQRHISRDLMERLESPRTGDRNPELAGKAIQKALLDAGVDVGEIGYLIGHTATPAMPIPSNISLVADAIGYNGPHAEFRQACTGFANALVFASGLLGSGYDRPIVIVGSETGSAFFDPDRLKHDNGQLVNLVQMGDAAAAIVLAPVGSDYHERAGRVGTLNRLYYGQIGEGREPGFCLPDGGSDSASAPNGVLEFSHAFSDVRANGPELFLAGLRAAATQNIDPFDMDYILPHQANGLMGVLMEQHLGIDATKVVVQADRVGNTGSAAIWLALTETRRQMKSGEKLLALGAEATKYMFGGFVYEHG